MRIIVFIGLLFVCFAAVAQKDSALMQQSKRLHQMIVKKDFVLVNHLDDKLSYGHSNGWIETKEEVLHSIVQYNSIVEDSITAIVSGKIGYVRFKGSFDVTMQGKQTTFNLKVLEVWRKKKGSWKLFARQAIRVQ
jgi:hypothetical protein